MTATYTEWSLAGPDVFRRTGRLTTTHALRRRIADTVAPQTGVPVQHPLLRRNAEANDRTLSTDCEYGLAGDLFDWRHDRTGGDHRTRPGRRRRPRGARPGPAAGAVAGGQPGPPRQQGAP